MWFFGGSCISGKQPLLAQESNRSVSKLPSHRWSTQPWCSPAFCQLQTPLRHEFGQARGTPLLSLEGTFSLATGALGTLQSLAAGAESGAGDPPLPPSITTTLPWHTATLGSSQWQTSITEARSSKYFQLIVQTLCAIHHSFLHTPFWRIQCWKWSEIRIYMAVVPDYMFLIHSSIKIGVIFRSDEKTCLFKC